MTKIMLRIPKNHLRLERMLRQNPLKIKQFYSIYKGIPAKTLREHHKATNY